jgi:uncharacterized radical SAM superfamily Fe-S cluster-containing enzyme
MNKILYETKSICPICLDKIPADVFVEGNNVYLEKTCSNHGSFKTLIWRDAKLYMEWERGSSHASSPKITFNEVKEGCPFDCGLCPDHEGETCTAILEVTQRCNIRCPVCFASGGGDFIDPTIEDIRQMYKTILGRGGPCSTQLSGGEPTVRDDLPQIIKIGKEMGFFHIQVNTNGLRVSEDLGYLEKLKKSGADLIYLQFDGISDKTHRTLRGIPMLEAKVKAIDNCKKVELGVVLVPTIIPEVNSLEIGDIVSFAKKYMPVVKGIHFQPASYIGRFPHTIPEDKHRMTLPDVIKALIEQTNGELKMHAFVPRKRKDPHCAFSSVFVLSEDEILQPITKSHLDSECEPTYEIEQMASEEIFSKKATNFTNRFWRMADSTAIQERGSKRDSLRAFRKRVAKYSLTITGMPFQDVWNIDLRRLKGCCVHVVRHKKLIPFCAFYLTSMTGNHLYKNDWISWDR